MAEMKEYIEHKIEYLLTRHDFFAVFNRNPQDKGEWDRFCECCEGGLDGQIDWRSVFTCAKEAMEMEEEEK